MSDVHDWYEVYSGTKTRGLPATAVATLVDLGFACNTLVTALNQAVVHERDALAAEYRARTEHASTGAFGAEAAHAVADSAASLVDQLTVGYTRLALAYAVHAHHLLVPVLDGRSSPTSAEVASPAPSQFLADPIAHLPATEPPSGDLDPVEAEALLSAYRAVLDAVERYQAGGGPADAYDDPAAAAARGPDAFDLSSDLAAALHAYAATLVDGV
jgi:hypothetical protein